MSNKIFLILHADDLGMGNAVNKASFLALKRGCVTSGSILIPAPWRMQVVSWWKQNTWADLGLHLCLTSEWASCRWGPVLPASEVPGLIDEEGYFWRTVEDVVSHATPEEIEREIRAQIERALKLGLNPTHLDTHMGTLYATPEFFKIWIEAAKDFNIPPMLVSPESEIAKFRLQNQPEATRAILDQMKAIPEECAFPILDELVMDVEPVGLFPRGIAYKEIIEGLEPGVTQIIVHLAHNYPEMEAMHALWSLKRQNDFAIFADPYINELRKKRGVCLIGWRDFRGMQVERILQEARLL